MAAERIDEPPYYEPFRKFVHILNVATVQAKMTAECQSDDNTKYNTS